MGQQCWHSPVDRRHMDHRRDSVHIDVAVEHFEAIAEVMAVIVVRSLTSELGLVGAHRQQSLECCSESGLEVREQACRSAVGVAGPSYRDSVHTDPSAVADSGRVDAWDAALVAAHEDGVDISAGVGAWANDVPAYAAEARALDALVDVHTWGAVVADDEVVAAAVVCHPFQRLDDGAAYAVGQDGLVGAAAAIPVAFLNSGLVSDDDSRDQQASFRSVRHVHCFHCLEEISCLFHAAVDRCQQQQL